jgi:hypothetical protein
MAHFYLLVYLCNKLQDVDLEALIKRSRAVPEARLQYTHLAARFRVFPGALLNDYLFVLH